MSTTTLNGILKAKVLSLISWRIFAARSSLQITVTGEAPPDQNKEGSHEECDVEENVRTIGAEFKKARLDLRWSLLLRVDPVLARKVPRFLSAGAQGGSDQDLYEVGIYLCLERVLC